MKRLLILIALIITALMLLCSCGGSVDTSSDETDGGKTDSGIGNTDSDTTDSGTGSTDSGTGEAPPSGDGSGDLVDDPNVDDWWTDNKQ